MWYLAPLLMLVVVTEAAAQRANDALAPITLYSNPLMRQVGREFVAFVPPEYRHYLKPQNTALEVNEFAKSALTDAALEAMEFGRRGGKAGQVAELALRGTIDEASFLDLAFLFIPASFTAKTVAYTIGPVSMGNSTLTGLHHMRILEQRRHVERNGRLSVPESAEYFQQEANQMRRLDSQEVDRIQRYQERYENQGREIAGHRNEAYNLVGRPLGDNKSRWESRARSGLVSNGDFEAKRMDR